MTEATTCLGLQGRNGIRSRGDEKMDAERWIKEIEMMARVRQAVHAKERARADEEESIRQEAEKRAWLRELGRTDGDGSCILHIDEGNKDGN